MMSKELLTAEVSDPDVEVNRYPVPDLLSESPEKVAMPPRNAAPVDAS